MNMQFQASKFNTAFYIRAYEAGKIFINSQSYERPLVIFEDLLRTDLLPMHIEDFAHEHLQNLIELKPEIILLGSGLKQKFLEHAVLAPLSKKQIGIEIMNTRSAARTYNLLAEEGRKVLGAFFL